MENEEGLRDEVVALRRKLDTMLSDDAFDYEAHLEDISEALLPTCADILRRLQEALAGAASSEKGD